MGGAHRAEGTVFPPWPMEQLTWGRGGTEGPRREMWWLWGGQESGVSTWLSLRWGEGRAQLRGVCVGRVWASGCHSGSSVAPGLCWA